MPPDYLVKRLFPQCYVPLTRSIPHRIVGRKWKAGRTEHSGHFPAKKIWLLITIGQVYLMSGDRIKKGYKQPFTMIPNCTINSQKLSLDELGLLTYLTSKPDDWVIQQKDIQNNFGIGRDKFYKLIKSLIEKGFIHKKELRSSDGKFSSSQFVVYAQPCTENPDTAKPDTAKPDTAKPHLSNKEDIQRKNNKTPKPPSGADDLFDDGERQEPKAPKKKHEDHPFFDEWWEVYGKVGARKTASIEYSKAIKKASRDDLLKAAREYLSTKPDWQQTAHARTWLSQERFNDFLDSEPVDGAKAAWGMAIHEWQQGGKQGPMPSKEQFGVSE